MAYDKIITIRARLDDCLRYIQDGDKTALSRALDYIEDSNKTALGDEVILQSAINCTVENCYLDMQRTKERFGKPGGVVGYHLVHSYAPGEVTPEQAHEAGVEFARRLLGDKYEAVICTHINKEHLHCHIVFNSVSFVDGVKYRNAFKDYFEDIRGISNEVSRKYGFSVIQPEGSGQHYAEWNAERSGKTTIRDLVRQDLDAAIAASFIFASLLDILRKRGYTVKYSSNVKHTAVKPPGGARFLRLDSLGEDYTEEAILQRLRRQRGVTAAIPPEQSESKRYTIRKQPRRHPPVKRGSFRALYLYYLYLLSPRKKRPQKVPFETRAEVRRAKQYRHQFFLLQKYHIDTKPELEMLSDALSNEMQIIVDRRKELYQKKLYGKVNMNRLLSEQRPIEVLPLRTEDFDEFKRRAKKVGLLFSTILDKKGDAPYLEILTNIDHLSQANYILEQMGYQPKQPEDAQPKKAQTPAQPEPSLQKQRSGLTQGTTSISSEEKQPVRGRLAALRAAAERTRPEPQRELEHIR